MVKFNIYLLMTSLFITTFFVSCEKKSLEDKIVGEWEYQMILSKDHLSDKAKESFPKELNFEGIIKGKIIFHKNGKYKDEMDMIVKYFNSSKEISMDFYMEITGDWVLQSDDKELSKTIIDSSISSENEMVKTNTLLLDSMKPLKGSTDVLKIMSISETIIELKPQSNLKLILSRIENEKK